MMAVDREPWLSQAARGRAAWTYSGQQAAKREKRNWTGEPDFCGWLRDQIGESSVNKGQLLECRVLSDIFTFLFFQVVLYPISLFFHYSCE
jgi:hypothetical protein